MWPGAERLGEPLGANPAPSSITSSRTAPSSTPTCTPTTLAPACLATLRSSSRASDSTSSSRGPGRLRRDLHVAGVAGRRGLLGADRAQRRLQAADLQLHRVQVEHHLADLRDRAREAVADAAEVALVALGGRPQPRDVVPERQQVLQRPVVQRLGDAAARAVLRVEGERHEPAARLRLRGDLGLGAQPRLRRGEHVGHRRS